MRAFWRSLSNGQTSYFCYMKRAKLIGIFPRLCYDPGAPAEVAQGHGGVNKREKKSFLRGRTRSFEAGRQCGRETAVLSKRPTDETTGTCFDGGRT